MEWKILQFGEFHLDTGSRTLRFRSAHVPIRPREFDLLALMASAAGTTVLRDDIVAALWSYDDVSVAAVTQSMYRLRCTLAECDPRQIYIVAGPRRGYQFVQRCKIFLRRGT